MDKIMMAIAFSSILKVSLKYRQLQYWTELII